MAEQDVRAWFEAESPAVRRHLLALCRDPQLAEDLTQETFLEALSSLRGYRGGNARAYLLGIARHDYAGHLRREARRRDAEARGGAPPPQETAPFAQGQGLLPALAPEDLALVVQRGVWGLPFAEIAQGLGRTENWARVRYFRLLARLRDEILEGGDARVRR